jgi:hypothetical protein
MMAVSRSRLSQWLGRAPLLVAAAVIVAIIGWNLTRLVAINSPSSPWEAAEVVEAWRSLHGLPVYELAPDGHATHMYGALVPWVQGEIFRWVGPNNTSGRVLTLVSALVTVTLLAVTVRSRGSAWSVPVAWAALLGVNHRSGQYFVENRPDLTALMLATVGLLAIGCGQERRRWRLVALGSACLVAGFFFKQTVLVFAAVPPVALALSGRRPARQEVLLALVPMAACGAAVLGLKLSSPVVYHYMIEVPRAYVIDWPAAAKHVRRLLIDSPLFLVLIGQWMVRDGASLRSDARIRWLLAALAVAIPSGAIAAAKFGGAANSLLPALLAIMAFAALRLPEFLERSVDPAARPTAQWVLGGFLALLLLMTTFPHVPLIVNPPPWDRAYPKVVAQAAGLPGIVVCPEDPTIPLHALQHAGRSLVSELDAHPVAGTWPHHLPDAVLADLRAADYVVDVHNYWDGPLGEAILHDLDFAPVEGVPLDPAHYRIWRRRGAGPSPAVPRTALNRRQP